MTRSAPPTAERNYRFEAFGTTCSLRLAATAREREEAFVRDAVDWARWFQAEFSRFESDSRLARLNASAGREGVEATDTFARLLDLAHWAFAATGGAVDVTSLPLYELWHEAAGDPDAEAIEATRARVGFDRVERGGGRVRLPDPGMAIDFGGIGKEFAVDQVAELAARHRIPGGMIAFGGDLRIFGERSGPGGWRIGVEHPADARRRIAYVRLRRGALASSGIGHRGSRRGGRRVPHLIDPRTGRPADAGVAVTAHGRSCAAAGVHATAACLAEDRRAALAWLEDRAVPALVVDPEHGVAETAAWSRSFPAE